jgi:hypothetical protein
VVVLDGDTGTWLANKMRRDVATATTAQTTYDDASWGGGRDGDVGLGQGNGLGVPSPLLAGGSGVAKG